MLHFSAPQDGRVELDVYDLKGKRLARILDTRLPGGTYTLEPLAYIDRSSAKSLYLVKLKTNDQAAVFAMASMGERRYKPGVTPLLNRTSVHAGPAQGDTVVIQCPGCQEKKVTVNQYDLNLGKIAVASAEGDPFEEIVFAVRDLQVDGHWYANFSYFWNDVNRKAYTYRGKLCKLNLQTGETTELVDDPGGSIRDPQVHYDGNKIIFSWRKGGTENFNLYEINTDGTGIRQITNHQWDDIEATYLPDGGIMFASSRGRRWVPCWITQVATLHRCDGDGSNIRELSANVEQDNTPWPLPDGRLLYTRWEYVDRSQAHYHHLWFMNPDGTGQMIYYGNQHPGGVFIDAKPIPGSEKVVMVHSPNHGDKEHRGYISLVTPEFGPDALHGKKDISDFGFRDPYPLSANEFLVAIDNKIMMMDSNGNTNTLYTNDGDWVHEPRPLRARPREPVIPNRVNLHDSTGKLILLDTYIGRNMTGVERGAIKKLLVLEVLPKPINYTGGGLTVISYHGSFLLNRVLGTVPVESDGSAYMELPANRSLFYVALDENDLSVKRMQSFLTVMPGELTTCIGCHEDRTMAVPQLPVVQALQRGPSIPEPIPNTPEIFDYPRDIQPIWDQYCLDCHDVDKREGRVLLTGDNGPCYTISYFELTRRLQMACGRNQYRSNYAPYTIGSSASPLMKLLDGSHYGVTLDAHSLRMVKLWIDASATHPGTYAAMGHSLMGRYVESNPGSIDHPEHQFPEVQAARGVLGGRCRNCHIMPDSPSDDLGLAPGQVVFHSGDPRNYPLPWVRDGRAPDDYYTDAGSNEWMKKYADERLWYSKHICFDLTRPEKSLALLAPLAAGAGGYGICGDIFSSTQDSDYQTILLAIQKTKELLDEMTRFNMPQFRPTPEYVREMKRYGILPQDHDANAFINPYEIDQQYWESQWWKPVPDTTSTGIVRRK
jgi:hypothetical protein